MRRLNPSPPRAGSALVGLISALCFSCVAHGALRGPKAPESGGGCSIPRPSRLKHAATARWLVACSSWGSVSTSSLHLDGSPFGNVHSLSDLVSDASTGTPYFYLTPMDPTVTDSQKDPRASLALVENAVGTCVFDPDDPLCVKLTLSGRLEEVPGGSAEFEAALAGMFRKHPEMRRWPAKHGFALFALRISDVFLIDFFGAAKAIPVTDYYNAALPLAVAVPEPRALPGRSGLPESSTLPVHEDLRIFARRMSQTLLQGNQVESDGHSAHAIAANREWHGHGHVAGGTMGSAVARVIQTTADDGRARRGGEQGDGVSENEGCKRATSKRGMGAIARGSSVFWEGVQRIKALAASTVFNNLAAFPDSTFARARPNPVRPLPPIRHARRSLVAQAWPNRIPLLPSILHEMKSAGNCSIPRPGRFEHAATARWLVACNVWGVISTKSIHLDGAPFGNIQSISDLIEGVQSGTPYFYLTTLDPTAADAERDPLSTLTLGEDPLGTCHVDPENPLCAKLTLTGNLERLLEGSNEHQDAIEGLFLKHPEMSSWPADHGFGVYALRIQDIFLIDFFGGPKPVTPSLYYTAKL